MLTTRFEEVKVSDDDLFDSFYGRLNEIVIAKLNLGEKIEDAKVVRKILRSLPESFQAKVTTIEESKDLDEVKIQELIAFLQTYEVVFLAMNFQKFLKMTNNGKSFGKGKFSFSKIDKREFKKKDGKDSSSTQGIVCYECNGHGHLKKECPNYLTRKGKVLATTLSDLKAQTFDVEGECDSDGNYSAFMAITTVDYRDELSDLVDELVVYSEGEEIDVLEDEDMYLKEGQKNLQEMYDVLLEDCGKYAKVVQSATKKIKKIEEEHKSTLVQFKEAKCEVEELKEELMNAYSKIKFLELKIIQANVKLECISTKKLDNVLSYQKTFI